MDFWALFSANLILALIIIVIYFGLLYFLIYHYFRTKEEILTEDNFVLFGSVKFKKISDMVIGVMCFAMVLYLLGALGWFLYNLTSYYLSLMDISLL